MTQTTAVWVESILETELHLIPLMVGVDDDSAEIGGMDAARAALDRQETDDYGAYQQARAAHDAAWRRSNELAMRLPIVHVLDADGGYRHLTEAEAAHQHWLDEFARTAAALEATYGTQI